MNEAVKPRLKAAEYKTGLKPIWCPGCGHFGVLSAITKALAYLALPKEKTALVSGIGCSSRTPAYVDVFGFHGVHGRALPVASGLKAARPDLTVLVVGGDGDGYSIGGNHFLHACRRNMNLTYIVMDNEVYGMTKGQASPTTAPDWSKSKLTPHGSGLRQFKPAAIAISSGAGFIARGFSGDPNKLSQLIVEGINYPGFAFIEVLSPCITFRPEQKQWKENVHWQAQESTDDPVEAVRRIVGDDRVTTGILYRREFPVMQPLLKATATVADLESEFLV
jgi:2-oxoglutarate/2-oxoacid ferredoxin oxidoreductase subunit beta